MDIVPPQERRKLVASDHGWTLYHHKREGNSLKSTKMCSLKNKLWLLKVCEETYSKNQKRWRYRKTVTDINIPHKLKGNAERKRKTRHKKKAQSNEEITRWQSPTGIFQIQNMIVIASLSQI